MEQLPAKSSNGLGVNRSAKSSFSRDQRLNGVVVSRGELTGDAACLDSWRPYVAVGPARQSSACPTARHGAPGRVVNAISTLVRPLSRLSSSPRRRRCFGELMRSRLSVSGQATPSSAPLASPQHRRRVGCGYRALVSPHCPLRRELTLLELRHGHRRRGQGSVVHHFSSFLSQKLR